jgi:WD40 repeat protein
MTTDIRQLAKLCGDVDGNTCIAMSVDGQYLAVGHENGSVLIWDVKSTLPAHTLLDHTSLVTSLAFSYDGRYLASGSWDRDAKLWDCRSGALLETFPHNAAVSSLSFTPLGNYLITATGATGGSVYRWDLKTLQCQQIYSVPAAKHPGFSSITQVVCGTDGETVYVGYPSGLVQVDIDGMKPVQQIADQRPLKIVQSSETGDVYFTSPSGVGHYRHGERVERFSPSREYTSGFAQCIAISGNNLLIAIGYERDSETRSIELVELASGRPVGRINRRGPAAHNLGLSPSGNQLAVQSHDRCVELWDIGPVLRAAAGGRGFGPEKPRNE